MSLKLKRAAGAKREQARAEWEKLTAFLERQAEGTLEDGESKLTNQEIKARREAIDSLYQEAAALEDVDSLDGMFKRDPDDMSQKAQELALVSQFREVLSGFEGKQRAQPKGEFSTVGQFVRAVRGLSGLSDVIDFEPMTEGQKQQMVYSFRAAVRFAKGDTFRKELTGGDEGGDRALKHFQEMQQKTLVGDNTGSAGRADFLVPTEHFGELLMAMGEDQQFINVARQVPMARRTADFPRLAQTTVADTRPVFSFAAISKIGEGAQKDEREPTFEQLVLTAIKYAAYVEASDELLLDSIVSVPPVLIQLLTAAIGYEYDRDGMRGAGTTEPQGFLGHASEWVQNRLAANNVQLGDVLGLEERFFGGGPNSRYLHHPSVLPKLGALAASNVIFWNRDVSGRLPGTLVGRPLVRTHKLPTVGTKGDLCLVDPGFYLAGNLQSLAIASSTHFRFRNDITAWRATFRGAGTPWPAGPFSMESSGTAETFRVSPFCVLGDVATS